MQKLEKESDFDALHGEIESRTLEIKGVDQKTNELLIKTEEIVKTVQGILNGIEEDGQIILGLSENANQEVDKNKKTPLHFPCSIKDQKFQPKNFAQYRDHIYKMIKDNTNNYVEGLVNVRRIPATAGGEYIVIEVKQSKWRPHRHTNGRCYIRRDGFTEEMTPAEQEFESLEKHKRLQAEGYIPSNSGSQAETAPRRIEISALFFPEPGKPFVTLLPFGQRREARDIHLAEGAREFLHLRPTTNVKQQKGVELRDLMKSQDLPLGPFGRWTSSWPEMNKEGAVTFQQSAVDETIAYNLTQVFTNSEILGIDAFLLNAERLMERGGSSFPYIPTSALEEDFEAALTNYLRFAEKKLQLPLRIKFVAGVTGVKGYALAVPSSVSFEQYIGNIVEDEITYVGTIEDYNVSVGKVLQPFFEKIWETAGVKRPSNFSSTKI